MSNQKNNISKLKELAEDIDICMFISFSNNEPHGRPMSTNTVDEDGSIWFFTNDYTSKVEEISQDGNVYLTYSSKSKNEYLTVHGKAILNDDKSKMEALWSPALNAWFPEGLDDPKILLIEVKPTQAEYWEGPSNKLVMAFGMVKALVKGEEYDQGENEKLSF